MQSHHEPEKPGQLILSLKDVCCECCDSAIRDAVTYMQGITNVDIDYAKNVVTVNYNPKKASLEKIIESIQRAGFEPNVVIDKVTGRSIAESGHDHHAAMVQKGKANELKIKVIASGVIFILVFLGSFPQWFHWVPGFLKNNFVLLSLATPVQFWAGSQFYIGAWAALKRKTSDMHTLYAVGTSAAYFYSALITLNGLKDNDMLGLVASAESRSEHPLGQAILNEAKKRNLRISEPRRFEALAGHGIRAQVDGKDILVGTSKLMEAVHVSSMQAVQS